MNGSRFLCLLILLAFSMSASVQSNYAALGGTVFDPEQKAVPEATVKLPSLSTLATRQATSNEQGMFQFTGLLGENPIRANYTGQPVFISGTHTVSSWFNHATFATPAAFTFGNVGRNTVYGPGLETLDLAVQREFGITEKNEIPIPRRVLQCIESYESRHAQPLRKHPTVRHDYRGGNAWPRDSVWCATLFLIDRSPSQSVLTSGVAQQIPGRWAAGA